MLYLTGHENWRPHDEGDEEDQELGLGDLGGTTANPETAGRRCSYLSYDSVASADCEPDCGVFGLLSMGRA
jgi:hypothetical protein